MANEAAKDFVTDLLGTIQDRVREMSQAQQQWAQMTATGSAAGKRVTVVVNAEGVVIETRFTADAERLTLTELARAVTTAAQDAAATAKRNTAALMAPLTANSVAMPKVSDFFPELPDIAEHFPQTPEVSTAAPDSPERADSGHKGDGPGRDGISDVFDGRGR